MPVAGTNRATLLEILQNQSLCALPQAFPVLPETHSSLNGSTV